MRTLSSNKCIMCGRPFISQEKAYFITPTTVRIIPHTKQAEVHHQSSPRLAACKVCFNKMMWNRKHDLQIDDYIFEHMLITITKGFDEYYFTLGGRKLKDNVSEAEIANALKNVAKDQLNKLGD